jgi:hypothetical protein
MKGWRHRSGVSSIATPLPGCEHCRRPSGQPRLLFCAGLARACRRLYRHYFRHHLHHLHHYLRRGLGALFLFLLLACCRLAAAASLSAARRFSSQVIIDEFLYYSAAVVVHFLFPFFYIFGSFLDHLPVPWSWTLPMKTVAGLL